MYKKLLDHCLQKYWIVDNIANFLQQNWMNSYRDMLEAWRESPARRLLTNPKTLPISERTQCSCSNNLNSWSPNERFPAAKIDRSACTIGCLWIASLSLCWGQKNKSVTEKKNCFPLRTMKQSIRYQLVLGQAWPHMARSALKKHHIRLDICGIMVLNQAGYMWGRGFKLLPSLITRSVFLPPWRSPFPLMITNISPSITSLSSSWSHRPLLINQQTRKLGPNLEAIESKHNPSSVPQVEARYVSINVLSLLFLFLFQF